MLEIIISLLLSMKYMMLDIGIFKFVTSMEHRTATFVEGEEIRLMTNIISTFFCIQEIISQILQCIEKHFVSSCVLLRTM